MTTLRELHEARSRSIAAMRALTDDPKGDGDLSAEQAAEFDRLKTEVTSLEARVARQVFLDEVDRRAVGTTIAGNGDDKLATELRSFSLLRAIASQVPDLAHAVDGGREREVSAELQRRSGRGHQGITCPMAVFERRVQESSTAALGGFLVPGQFRGDLFIDTLRAKLVTARLGATVLNDLSGQVDIPRRTASSTGQWVSENTAIDLSDPAFGQVSMTPRTVGARTELTRNLLLQSSPDAEQLTRNDFASVIAEAIDVAAINGSGIGAVPKGLLQFAIGSFNLATINLANLLAAVEDLPLANADEGRLGWTTHQRVVKILRTTLKTSADTLSNMLMTEPGSLAGYPMVSSTIVPTNVGAGSTKSALIFGNWADLIIGYWGLFDLLVNPYESTAYSKGNVQVRAMLNTDVNVRQLLSFTAAVDIV